MLTTTHTKNLLKQLQRDHDKAMGYAMNAMIARERGGNPGSATDWLAFYYERRAAKSAAKADAPEPTRSILIRSAITLGIRAKVHPSQCRRLAELMSPNAPAGLVDEVAEAMAALA